jgi:hypothetical protein
MNSDFRVARRHVTSRDRQRTDRICSNLAATRRDIARRCNLSLRADAHLVLGKEPGTSPGELRFRHARDRSSTASAMLRIRCGRGRRRRTALEKHFPEDTPSFCPTYTGQIIAPPSGKGSQCRNTLLGASSQERNHLSRCSDIQFS